MCEQGCKSCGIKHTPRAQKVKKEARFKTITLWVGTVILIGAYVYGKVTNQPGYQKIFDRHYPQSIVDRHGQGLFLIHRSDTLWAKLKTAENNGYGGPLEVGVVINRDMTIEDVVVIAERETRSFFNRLLKKNFFEQFRGLSVSEKFEPGKTIDGVSGATVSSVAFTRAIRKAAHQYAKSEHGLAGLSPSPALKFGTGEIAVLALLIWSAALYFKKNKVLQYLMHLSALVLIGFYLNLSISITNFGSVLQGYFPNIYDHLVWYMLTIGVLLVAIVFGKNIYCYRICPFYAVQWMANQISGINLNPGSRIGKLAKYLAGVLLWASLLIGFLTATPSSGSYEPFATIFSFEGEGVQWFIFPAVFFTAFFIKDVFCRYYCPVGSFLKFLIVKVRKPIFKQLKAWQNVSKEKQVIS